jgi:hypothetical protein
MNKYKSHIFPDITITKRGPKFLEKYPESPYVHPFNIETGELLAGDYKGKTLDEVFDQDPGYLLRMSYYWSSIWSVDHKAAFLHWTRLIER